MGYSWPVSKVVAMNASTAYLVLMEVKGNVQILPLVWQSVCHWSCDSGLHRTSGILNWMDGYTDMQLNPELE